MSFARPLLLVLLLALPLWWWLRSRRLGRLTGTPGACLGTFGPGATNLVTGLATAHMDSVPVVGGVDEAVTVVVGTGVVRIAGAPEAD